MPRFCSAAIVLSFALACASSPGSPLPGDIAATYAAAGRLDEASREIEVAIRMHPRDVSLRRQAARIYTQAGHTDRAIGHLESAIERTPRDESLWIRLADLELDRENVADAYVAYRTAAKLEPTDLRAVSGLAITAEGLGFAEESRAALARRKELERRLGSGPANQ
jgi:tetratricopeptide (TPR) repeat protein